MTGGRATQAWCDRPSVAPILEGARGRAHLRRRGARAARVTRPRRRRARCERDPEPQGGSRPHHVHRRPQPQLHEHLPHRLRLLRLLPQPRRHTRGLPAAEAGHLQEDRRDTRARRHRAPDAGRPPPGSRHRLLRGSVPLDQGALQDPPARTLAAGDPAHLAAQQADALADDLPPARRRARLDPRRRRRDPRRPRPRR